MDKNTRSEARCDQQAELVTYLYDEATPSERGSFEQHLQDCSLCRAELSSFSRVRNSLGAWNPGLDLNAPRMEIAIKRNSIETLRDVLGVFAAWPVWLRFAGATTMAAVALVVGLSVAGTRIDFAQGTVSFGMQVGQAPGLAAERGLANDGKDRKGTDTVQLTRAEIETMISTRVAAARAEELERQQELKARIATLSAQLAAAGRTQGRMSMAFASLRAEQQALAARGQSTLGEWLFAANGSREAWGGNDEKDN